MVLYKIENVRRSPPGPVGRTDDYGVEHPVPAQQWSTLGVSFDDTRSSVTFDGQHLFQAFDSTCTEPDALGLRTKADSVTYFDGFEVEVR